MSQFCVLYLDSPNVFSFNLSFMMGLSPNRDRAHIVSHIGSLTTIIKKYSNWNCSIVFLVKGHRSSCLQKNIPIFPCLGCTCCRNTFRHSSGDLPFVSLLAPWTLSQIDWWCLLLQCLQFRVDLQSLDIWFGFKQIKHRPAFFKASFRSFALTIVWQDAE